MSTSKEKENRIRVNLSVAPSVKQHLDKQAEEYGMSVSAYVTMCIQHYRIQYETINMFEKMNGIDFKEIQNKNENKK